MGFSINRVIVGIWKVNCYLITIDDNAWLIDPGDEYEKIVSSFNLNHVSLKGILLTHGHFDHIGAVYNLKKLYNIPLFVHSKDERLIYQSNLYRKLAGDSSIKETPVVDKHLDNLPFISLCDNQLSIYHIPGHTNGSVCFAINKNLFSGDIIFKNEAGRTDLPGGNKKLLLDSLDFIYNNFIDFNIYPGHGESFILEKNLLNKIKSNGINY